MAINPFMPLSYQAYQNQAQPQQVQQVQQLQPQQQMQTGITWVLGEEGAKSYPVAPNNTVALWDSEMMVIYLKSVDGFGRPSMTVLDYTMRNQSPPRLPSQQQQQPQQQPQQQQIQYVTREEMQATIRDLEERLRSVENGKPSIPKDESGGK